MNIIKSACCIFILFFSCKNNPQHSTSSGKSSLDGIQVPEGFTIEKIVDQKLISFPMLASFDSAGRLFVFESDGSTPSTEEMLKKPSYHVRLLQDTDDDGVFDRSTIFADSLTIPKGGVFYHGSLYVTASPDFLRITDTDNDGVGDKTDTIQTGWKLDHNAAVLGGPFLGPDGWMYLTDARRGFDITNKERKHYIGKGPHIWRCRPDGSGLEPILGGGYDNAIELVFMPGGETIGTMTYFLDPQGGLRDALMHWEEGGVYPKPHSVIQEDKLKLTGELMPVMTKLARVAPAGIMRYKGTTAGKEFEGNLFSAEFNTGRIMRSVISSDGATFKTVDEPFITSTVPDVHFTDVFEDADGSLIVINTGGWFIAGCPLSRVAKLDIPGGIYRIRKNNAPKVEDPWGRNTDLKKLTAEEVATLAMDGRPMVSANAIQELADRGAAAVDAVIKKLLSAKIEEVRATGIFVLGRIGTPEAMNAVLNSFNDTGAIIKTAAARVAGLAKYKNAVAGLQKLVVGKNLAVRRQAAIALEQVGDTSAVRSLLEAAADSNDRYAEHAIIHALIMLKNSGPLVRELSDASPSVKKAAVIALDQMDGYALKKENIVPFLNSYDATLQSTGMWVASHHNDWGDVVVNFLSTKKDYSDKDVNHLLITFSNNVLVQKFIADKLSDKTVNSENRKILFDVISRSPVKKIPPVWISLLGKYLKSDDSEIQSMSLSVVQSRRITQLNDQLGKIILDRNAPPELKAKAMVARLSSDPLLTSREFDVVLELLDAKNSMPVRHQAGRILTAAELSNAQLTVLATKIPGMENYLVPDIFNAFEGNMNPETGGALLASLKSSPQKLENISEEDFRKVIAAYPASVKSSASPLLQSLQQKNAARLSQLQATESTLKNGDVGRGRLLFFGKATCSTCHAINNEGSRFAPDLTNIGQIRSQHDIVEAIMFPSASFAREHETSRIVTKTNTYTGIIREQFPEAVVIATGPGAEVRIQRSEIISIEQGTVSMMPPGLDKQLSTQELSDLIAYLASLPDGAGGRIGY